MSEQKARTLLAKYQAYSNAAEMIRGHGEEGFAFADEKFDDVYKRETMKLAKSLDKKAFEYLEKYEHIGIDISSEIDDSYF